MSKTVHSLDVPVICGTLSTRWDCDAGTVDNSGRAVRIYDARNGGGENKHSHRVIDRNGKHGRGGNARRFFGNPEKQARTRLQGRYSTFLQRGKSHAGMPCRSLGQDLGRMPQCPRIVLWRPPEGRFLKVPVTARLPQSPGCIAAKLRRLTPFPIIIGAKPHDVGISSLANPAWSPKRVIKNIYTTQISFPHCRPLIARSLFF